MTGLRARARRVVHRAARRLAGPDPAVLSLMGQVALLRHTSSSPTPSPPPPPPPPAPAVVELEDLVEQLEVRALAAEVETRRLIARLAAAQLEPPPSGACRKIRLRDHGEADVFIASLAADFGRAPADFSTYRCPVCPRQPVGVQRWLHVTHADPDERADRAARTVEIHARSRAGRGSGRSIEARLTSAGRAALRARVQPPAA